MQRVILLLIATALLTGGGLVAAEAEGKSSGEQEFILAPDDEAKPEKFTRRIDQFRKEMDEPRRVKVVIGTFFNQNYATRDEMIAALIPLDEKGRPHGVAHYFGGDTRLERRVTWRHGVRHGPEVELARETGWRPYDRKVTPYREGTIHGTVKIYYPDGKLQTEIPYVDGVQEGVSRTYARDGTVLRQVTFKGDERHGEMVERWPTTKELRRVIPYRDGEVHGLVRQYYDSGRIRREIQCRDGDFHGKEVQYDEEGEVIKTRWWFRDDVVDGKAEFARRTREAATRPTTRPTTKPAAPPSTRPAPKT